MIYIEYPNEGVYAGGKARWTRRDPETGAVTYARLATPAEELLGLQIEAMNRLTQAVENANAREELHAMIAKSNALLAKQSDDGVRDLHACETGGECECGNALTGGQCFP